MKTVCDFLSTEQKAYWRVVGSRKPLDNAYLATHICRVPHFDLRFRWLLANQSVYEKIGQQLRVEGWVERNGAV